MSEPLSTEEIAHRVPAEWTTSGDRIEARYTCSSFTAAGRLVAAIAELADAQNHHPDLALAYPGQVHVILSSHDTGGVSERDLEQASRIAELAGDAEVGAPE
jgi:4a-hydroxytetrahydrobiopterin dehydratase